MRTLTWMLLLSALAGCEATDTLDADAAVADAQTDTAVATDVQPTDVSADTSQPACSEQQLAACDDNNPCTTDLCDGLDGTCSHSQSTAPCDDGDPCTISDACAGGDCVGKVNSCDDQSPCTIDDCQLDGSCTHVHNQHEDCLPLIELSYPPRGLRLNTTTPDVTVSGKVVAQNSKPKSLSVQGQEVAFAADGSFSTTVPLVFGAQTLVLEVTDPFGGVRHQVQGVHWAPQWNPDDQSIQGGLLQVPITAASWLQGALALLPPQSLAVAKAFSPDVVNLSWNWSGGATPVSSQPQAAMAAKVEPVSVPPVMAVKQSTDPGTPLRVSCGPTDLTAGSVPTLARWSVRHDLINAALRAAWLGGSLTGDVSPMAKDLAPGITFQALSHAEMPWLLVDCPGPDPVLRLNDLRIDVQAFIGDSSDILVTGVIHLSIDAQPVFAWKADSLTVSVGKLLAVDLDVVSNSPDSQATDLHVWVAKAIREVSAPLLVAEWAKQPLVTVPLPPVPGPLAWLWSLSDTILNGAVAVDGTAVGP